MKTRIEKISSYNIEKDLNIIEEFGKIIFEGGLLAFPTETVYGLGGNAFLESSIQKIYMAKKRPFDNPLIVHIANIKDLEIIAEDISENAKLLISNFWPGPLTIILKKTKVIPNITAGGLSTVGVRMPSNNIARLLIEKSKVPIAATSANISGKPSSTNVLHVMEDLAGRIDGIIDGGDCEIGLESTVINMEDKPCILRLGSITVDMIEKIIGRVDIDNSLEKDLVVNSPKSPGMKYKHYAPKAEILIVSGERCKVVKKIKELVIRYSSKNVGIMASDETIKFYEMFCIKLISLGSLDDGKDIAKNLFKVLRKFDEYNVDIIFTEDFIECNLGFVIMDRIKKASSYNIINV